MRGDRRENAKEWLPAIEDRNENESQRSLPETRGIRVDIY